MSKKWLLAGLLLVPCLLAACGIAQEDYDAVVADFDNVQQELETLEEELVSTLAMLDTTELLLTKKTEDVSSLEYQIQQLQDNLEISYEYSDNLSEELRLIKDTNLSEELSLIKNPKLFESTDEFGDWLEDNQMNKVMANLDVTDIERCFILQVMALRDGYLFPAVIYLEDDEIKVANQAYVGSDLLNFTYSNGGFHAFIETWQRDLNPIPVHPLPLD